MRTWLRPAVASLELRRPASPMLILHRLFRAPCPACPRSASGLRSHDKKDSYGDKKNYLFFCKVNIYDYLCLIHKNYA